MKRWYVGVAVVLSVVAACSKDQPQTQLQVDNSLTLRWNQSPTEVRDLCASEQKRLLDRLSAIGAVPAAQATFVNTVQAIELATAEFGVVLNPVTFLKYVSPNEEVRAAADDCETSVSQLYVDLFAREDLYLATKAASAKGESLDRQSDQLLKEYLVGFKRNGLELPADQRRIFIEKKKALVKMEADFSTNLNEYKDDLRLTLAELDGLPESYVRALKKDPDGKYIVGLSYPHYYPFMENAKNADARKRLEFKFNRRGGEKNRDLLAAAASVRHQLAGMLGYPTHAAYVLDRQMAKSAENVTVKFLQPLIQKLLPKGRQDLAEMAEYKKKELNDPNATTINSWDWRYYANQLKKQKHQFDNEKVREYFPLEVVLNGMFEIYQTLLGVRFVAQEGAVWHDSVKLYRIEQDGVTMAYFLMDLFPREGKYGHAAAFTIVNAFVQANGTYRAPVSSIVANFKPALPGEPSLLEHSEVETLFHEFGHIMHQTLTKARYATFSGTSVNRDFVEAPSQMLENWVWEPEALAKLSGHYQTKQPLPADLVRKMVGAKLHNSGVLYLRQAAFATLDMQIHTQPAVDTTAVYAQAMKDVMMVPIQAGTYPEASFGHLMGGYDAGYYGYLWSEVYAADMFTRFSKEGLLNQETGVAYRAWILEPGGTKSPFELISGFLGREPNQDAFLKSLGL